jgi:hypothetical protein
VVRRLARFLSGFGWAIVLLIMGGFVWFAIEISKPVEGTLRHDLVTGTLRPARELGPDGPFLGYVALYPGRPGDERPAYPLDDELPEDDGSFSLAADAIDGTRFYLLARIETAKEQLFCRLVPLPEVRATDEGWVAAATGEPLLPRRIVVDRSRPCDYY